MNPHDDDEIMEAENRRTFNNWYERLLECCGYFWGFFRTWIPCICCCVEYPYQVVTQSEYGLIQRFGRYISTVRAGLHYVNPCTEKIYKYDGRIGIIDLQKQIIVSKDNITLNLDATIYYQVSNAKKAHYKINNYIEAISSVVYSILKSICGQHVFQDFLDNREVISAEIRELVIGNMTELWGISVHEIFIKDITLSADVQTYLSVAAKERRKAERKIISAKADVESAKLMREASEILDHPAAMQIRYLETLNQIGTNSANPKIIFMHLENIADNMKK